MDKHRKRAQWGWCWFDFGNSAYAAVILLAVYAAYFQGTVVGGAEGTRLWGVSMGLAMLVVAVVSPILGAIADYWVAKKRFLFFFSFLSWTATALLFFVQKGDVFKGMLFFVLAEIGYRGEQVFYNALLYDVANADEMGRVSGNGWAFGSIGGIVCLLFILPAIVFSKSNGLAVRGSFVFTVVFFALATLPMFLWVKETRTPKLLPAGETHFPIAFKRPGSTFRSVRHFREYIQFIVSLLI